ncbi:hypothetical protein B0H13DRAFT_1980611 [Mycena leptocephala]|nr:hypothetical protein B0H13DRAFT_2013980 [Mycena leptocephala]KAJ7923406.1 hypothetical protein B0H13DRAFT_1980611 [Mycena leptocephala]
MLFTNLAFLFATSASVQAAVVRAAPPPVFTATRVYQTITDVPPYIITATTTMTWTQSPSTHIIDPTGPGGF